MVVVGYVRARNMRMIGGHIEYNNIIQEVVQGISAIYDIRRNPLLLLLLLLLWSYGTNGLLDGWTGLWQRGTWAVETRHGGNREGKNVHKETDKRLQNGRRQKREEIFFCFFLYFGFAFRFVSKRNENEK